MAYLHYLSSVVLHERGSKRVEQPSHGGWRGRPMGAVQELLIYYGTGRRDFAFALNGETKMIRTNCKSPIIQSASGFAALSTE